MGEVKVSNVLVLYEYMNDELSMLRPLCVPT